MKCAIPLLVAGLLACSGASSPDIASSSSTTDPERVVLDVRCAGDADCPSAFACEAEGPTTYCKGRPNADGSEAAGAPSACPGGFEREAAHGGIFCSLHGGGDDMPSGSGTATAPRPSTPAAAPTPAPAPPVCRTQADCPGGQECEVKQEHGVSTATCKPRKGKDKD